MLRRVLIGFLSVLLLAVVGAAGTLAWLNMRFAAPGPAEGERTVVLARGAGVLAIGRQLQAEGVIGDARLFAIGVRLRGQQGSLKAGEYRFAPGISMAGVMALLRSGETVVRRLTIPEGRTVAMVADMVGAADGLAGGLGDLPAEGSLLPETYHYSYGDPRREMVQRMQAAMTAVLDELWPRRQDGLPLNSRHEALVLASIVERETAVAAERAHIAGVFINRLRRGMRLQSDPTVVYALSPDDGDLDRPLTRADLEVDSPYNTYRRSGLPPGAIANPGRASIAAVLNPLATDDLYFVADGSGGHAFARTYDEHRRNVRRWRRLQRDERAKSD